MSIEVASPDFGQSETIPDTHARKLDGIEAGRLPEGAELARGELVGRYP